MAVPLTDKSRKPTPTSISDTAIRRGTLTGIGEDTENGVIQKCQERTVINPIPFHMPDRQLPAFEPPCFPDGDDTNWEDIVQNHNRVVGDEKSNDPRGPLH